MRTRGIVWSPAFSEARGFVLGGGVGVYAGAAALGMRSRGVALGVEHVPQPELPHTLPPCFASCCMSKPKGAEFQGGFLLGFSSRPKETNLNGPLNVFEHWSPLSNSKKMTKVSQSKCTK